MSRIVVGVDVSGSSDEAVAWAAQEAAVRGAALVLAHAVVPLSSGWGSREIPPERTWAAAEGLLHATRDGVHKRYPELEVLLELRAAGFSDEGLLEQAKGADLVVVGSHTRNLIGRLFLGSVSHFMVTHSPVPIVVVRRCPADPMAPVVVGVDDDTSSREALDFAFQRADERGVPLVAIHAWVLGGLVGYGVVSIGETVVNDLQSEAKSALQEALVEPIAAHPTVEVRPTLVQSDPASALVTAAEDAQLVVVGAHGRGGVGRLLMGSVSTNVLHAVDAPVVVVPTTTT